MTHPHNYDAAEVAKFENQAHEWWNPKGGAAPLHHLNAPRVQFISDRISLAQKELIDIGCGGGILSESLARKGAIVTGLDASPKLIEIAKHHAQESHLSIHYEYTTAESYAEQNTGRFDIVTCMELLEHVPEPQSLIHAAAKLVKSGGLLFFSTLNRNLKSYLLAIVGAEYILRILPKNTHEYEKFIRPSELEEWLLKSNLSLLELAGLSYNPFTKEATINKDVSLNYIAMAVKQ